MDRRLDPDLRAALEHQPLPALDLPAIGFNGLPGLRDLRQEFLKAIQLRVH